MAVGLVYQCMSSVKLFSPRRTGVADRQSKRSSVCFGYTDFSRHDQLPDSVCFNDTRGTASADACFGLVTIVVKRLLSIMKSLDFACSRGFELTLMCLRQFRFALNKVKVGISVSIYCLVLRYYWPLQASSV